MQNQLLEMIPPENYSPEFLEQKDQAIRAANLGRNERVYFSDETPIEKSPVFLVRESLVRESAINKEKVQTRPAKRKFFPEDAISTEREAIKARRKEQKEEQKRKWLADLAETKKEREANRLKKQEQKAADKECTANEKSAVAALMETAKTNTGMMKDTVPGRKFTPHIGPKDSTGKIKVQVNANTWLLVSPEKNIEEVIENWNNWQHKKNQSELRSISMRKTW